MFRQQMKVIVRIGRRRLRKSETRHFECRHGRKAQELEAVRDKGERLQIQVLGLARIAHDVSPELALATIESVRVLGGFQAPAAVRAALADRIQ